MKNSLQTLKAPGGLLKSEQLKEFLLAHLNRIYCAKSHLHERLPELAEQAEFADLKGAILKTRSAIGKQITRMKVVYVLIHEEPSFTKCDELIDFVENGFNPIHINCTEPGLRDLSILFYLSLIEMIEFTSFQLLQMVAIKMPDKQIKRVLQENLEESKAERVLFLQLTANYIS